MTDVPASHPRYASLRTRDAIVAGVERGVTSIHGLVAHGRGEAFDYLLGERTRDFARDAIAAAAAMLVTASRPVVSVNGNAAALVPGELVALATAVGAPIEVNIFHASPERECAIREHMLAHGAPDVLMPTPHAVLEHIDSNRRFVNPEGILAADVVFVPLEDGDRCQALARSGKRVITVDLNPMSRTARTATVTIVDNVTRAIPLLLERVAAHRIDAASSRGLLGTFDNERGLRAAEAVLRAG
ncbi:MAG: phosphopantothenate/pantothenate synthetase [Gammaproteobacteria bacterium]|nr:phosphopantothenate/pantothenate synthetase [Gammaproteobacteria bacterium]